MRLLIVDDERPARDELRRMLAQEPGIDAIEEARDGIEALERLPAFQPDALFLDIQMPELSGLELAASLPQPAPLVVFVTAFDEYAIRAFDANAIDYLLKPFDAAAAAARAAAPARTPARGRSRRSRRRRWPDRPPCASCWCPNAAARGSCRWPRSSGSRRRTTTSSCTPAPASRCCARPWPTCSASSGARFVRCHRRAAVQLALVERVVTLDKGDCELVLRGGARVPCSRQFRDAVLERL